MKEEKCARAPELGGVRCSGRRGQKGTSSNDKGKINLFHRSQGSGEEGASKGVRDKQILSGSEQVPVQRELRPVAESCSQEQRIITACEHTMNQIIKTAQAQ